MNILTSTELLRKTALYKEQHAFFGIILLKSSIFLYSVVFVLESSHTKLQKD